MCVSGKTNVSSCWWSWSFFGACWALSHGQHFRLLASLYLDYSIIIMIILALILGSYWQLPGEHWEVDYSRERKTEPNLRTLANTGSPAQSHLHFPQLKHLKAQKCPRGWRVVPVVKALATEPEALGSTPASHRMEGENLRPTIAFWVPHAESGKCAPPLHTHELSK